VNSQTKEISTALSLLSAKAVRERAQRMLALGLDDKLPNFQVDLARMDVVIDLVLETTRAAYPSLDVPFHSRWRHFVNAGDNRWADLADHTEWPDRAARGRAEFDLAITSVFLDAGAGPTWRYKDPKSGAPRDLVLPVSQCLPMAHSPPIPRSHCVPMPASSQSST
jgi:hypothetical protein